MRKIQIIIFVLCVFLYNIVIIPQNEKYNFYSMAKKIKTIYLSEKLLIGDITTLDVNSERNLLVVDKIGNSVYLFNSKGALLKNLSIEKCNPGINWRPFEAKFDKNGNILILNSNPWGFRFDSNGNCIGRLDLSFIAPLHTAFLRSGEMVGYYNIIPNVNYLLILDKYGKEKIKFGKFPKEYQKLIYRLEGGGLITDDNDNIYQINVSRPDIFKYDKTGKFIKSFKNVPSHYRKIEKDLSSYDPLQSLKELPKLLIDKTIPIDLFLLAPDKIMVQLVHNKNYIIQIFNVDGDYLLKAEIIVDRKVICAKDGLIYFISQPKPDKKGKLPNPIIEIYKLKSI